MTWDGFGEVGQAIVRATGYDPQFFALPDYAQRVERDIATMQGWLGPDYRTSHNRVNVSEPLFASERENIEFGVNARLRILGLPYAYAIDPQHFQGSDVLDLASTLGMPLENVEALQLYRADVQERVQARYAPTSALHAGATETPPEAAGFRWLLVVGLGLLAVVLARRRS